MEEPKITFAEISSLMNSLSSIDKKLDSVMKLQNYNKKKGILFYRQATITIATTTKPATANVISVGGSTGYTIIAVYNDIHRIVDLLQVQNLGPGDFYVITSHGAGYEWSDEILIKEGDTVYINEVYELRVRVTTLNTEYVVTEYDFYKNRDFVYKTGLPYISETTVAVAGVPNTENVSVSMGKKAVTGYIVNDGPGNLLVQISVDGTTYSNIFTMIPNQTVNFAEELFSMIIDASVNATAYRLNLH